MVAVFYVVLHMNLGRKGTRPEPKNFMLASLTIKCCLTDALSTIAIS